MKTKILLIILALIITIVPLGASAISTVEGWQAASDKAIYLDINQLNNEINRINARKGLTDSRKELLVNIAKADIQILEKMREDIAKETDLRMAKKDYKSIKTIFTHMKSGLRSAAGI